jgi:hypothetical protein
MRDSSVPAWWRWYYTHTSHQYFSNRTGRLITDGKIITNLAFGAGGRVRLSDMVSLEYAGIYNVPYFDGMG